MPASRMASVGFLSPLCLASLAACFEQLESSAPAGDGYFVVALVEPSNDAIVRAEIRRSFSSPLAPPDLEIVAWLLADDTHSFPASASEPTVVVDDAAPPAGSCGRCLAPRREPPWTIYPGDLCSPPETAPSFHDGTWVDDSNPRVMSLARRVRAAWPGECEFPTVELEHVADREYEPIHPESDEPPGFTVFSPDGSVLSVSLSGLALHGVDAVTRAPGDVGVPIAGFPLNDGSFLLGVADADPLSVEWRPVIVSRDLASTEIFEFPSLRLSRFEPIPEEPNAFVILGFDPNTRDGTAYRCTESLMSACDRLIPLTEFHYGSQANSSASVDGLLLIAADARESGGLPIALVDRRNGEYSDGLIPGAVLERNGGAEVHIAGSAGSRVYVLAADDNEVFILTRQLDRAAFSGRTRAERDAEIVRGWSLASTVRTRTKCASRASVGELLYLGCEDGSAFEAGPDGVSRWIEGSSVMGMASTMSSLQSQGEWVFGTSRSGAVYRRRGTSPATKALGPELEFSGVFGAAAPTEQGFVAFASGGIMTTVDVETSSVARRRTELVGQPIAAAVDPFSGRTWVASASTPAHGELYELEDGALRPTPLDQSPFIGGLTFPSPGAMIALASEGLVAIENGGLSPLAIDWDDPFTDEVEEPPPDCDHPLEGRAINRESAGPFRSIDSSLGVVWAVGCDLAIVRVTRGRDRWVVERFASNVTETSQIWSDRGFSVVRALAPDEIIVGANARTDALREQSALWRVRLSSDATHLETEILPQATHPPPDPRLGINGGPPVALIGPRDSFDVLQEGFWLSLVKSLGSTRTTIHFRKCVTAAWNEAKGVGLVGCGSENLLMTRPAP